MNVLKTYKGYITYISININDYIFVTYLIEADWRIYESPGRCQAIMCTNAGILLIGPLDKFQWNLNRNLHISNQENVFENVWKMVAILFQPQYVETD